MKALSLTQPWASLVACGVKRWETRGWSTAYRGMLAIHATAARVRGPEDLDPGFARICAEAFGPQFHLTLPRGAVLCLAKLVAVRPAAHVRDTLSGIERRCGDFADGRFAWQFADIDKLPRPVPARGFQSLWEWDEADPEGERRSREAAGQGRLF